jgi:CRP-like cAMP-binding protein/tetratricopeptide (TPR) repeat protein
VGRLHAFRVGTIEHSEFLVAGDLIRQIGDAEGCAARRQTVLSPEAWNLVKAAGVVQSEPVGDAGCQLLTGVLDGDGAKNDDDRQLEKTLLTRGLLELQRSMETHHVLSSATEPMLRSYVHPVAAGAIKEDMLGSMAEQRSVIVAFVKIDGLEDKLSIPVGVDGGGTESDKDALQENLDIMQNCLISAQRCIGNAGGMLRQFVLDDKGAVIIWSFGLPGSSFEDNARRGLRSAFDVVDALLKLGLSPRVGLTSGTTFCGLVGAPYRCEYAVMGPCVNLAARLMCACEKKESRVLCNGELRDKLVLSGSNDFNFTEYEPVKVKGYTELVTFCRPEPRSRESVFNDSLVSDSAGKDSHGAVSHSHTSSSLQKKRVHKATFGRVLEKSVLHGAVGSLALGLGGGVVMLQGEPGIGKSHLAAEVQHYCSGEDVQVATLLSEIGSGLSDPTDPLSTWRPIVLGALRVHHGLLPLEAALPVPVSCVARMLPGALQSDYSSLQRLLGNQQSEDGDTNHASRSRHSLETDMIVTLLNTIFAVRPYVVIIDNLHLSSSAAWDVLVRLATLERPMANFVLVSRPLALWADGGEPSCYVDLLEKPWTSVISLRPVGETATAAMVSQWIGKGTPKPAGLAEEIHARCGGNPLFTTMLLAQIDVDSILNVQISELKLPSSLTDTVLTQLDHLNLSEQIAVKTACVLVVVGAGGRRFERSTLQALYPGSASALDAALGSLEKRHYIRCIEKLPNDMRYQFISTAVSEVIYSLMLKEQRERFHTQIGELYERSCSRRHAAGLPLSGTGLYELLARHFGRAGDTEKTVRFLVAAGHEAVKSGDYKDAEQKFKKALDLCEESSHGDSESESSSIMPHVLVSLAEIYSRFAVPPPPDVTASDLLIRARSTATVQQQQQPSLRTVRLLAHITHTLAWLDMKGSDLEEKAPIIESAFDEAITLRRDNGFVNDLADSLNGLGCFLQMRSRALATKPEADAVHRAQLLERAKVALEESVQLRTQLGDSSDLAQSLCSLGNLLIDLEASATSSPNKEVGSSAIRAFERSVQLYAKALGAFHLRVAHALNGLAKTYKRAGQHTMAYGMLSQVKRIRVQLGLYHSVYLQTIRDFDEQAVRITEADAPWRHSDKPGKTIDEEGQFSGAAALALCSDIVAGKGLAAQAGNNDELRGALADAYPELGYFIGPGFADDGLVSDSLENERDRVISAMLLALRLAMPSAPGAHGGDGAAARVVGHVNSPTTVRLGAFAHVSVELMSAYALDELLVMLVVSSLCRVVNLVDDAHLVVDESEPISKASVLSPTVLAERIHLPSFARLGGRSRAAIRAALTHEFDLSTFMSGMLSAACLLPLVALARTPLPRLTVEEREQRPASTEVRVGGESGRILCARLLHDVLLQYGARFLELMDVTVGAEAGASSYGGCPEPVWARRACDALSALAELSHEATREGEGEALQNVGAAAALLVRPKHSIERYLRAVCAALQQPSSPGPEQPPSAAVVPQALDVVEQRLICLLGGEASKTELVELRAARAALQKGDGETLETELTLLASADPSNSVVSLRGLASVVPDCLRRCSTEQSSPSPGEGSSTSSPSQTAALAGALSAVARIFRVARDVLPAAHADVSESVGAAVNANDVASSVFRLNCSMVARVASDNGTRGLGLRVSFVIPAGSYVVAEPDEDSPAAEWATPFEESSSGQGSSTGNALLRLTRFFLSRRGQATASDVSGKGRNLLQRKIAAKDEDLAKLDYLRELKQLCFFGDELMRQMAHHMKTVTFAPDADVFKQGGVIDAFFIIGSGVVREFAPAGSGSRHRLGRQLSGLTGHNTTRRLMRELEAGDVIGIDELVNCTNDAESGSTYTACGPVECWRISFHEFQSLFGDGRGELEQTARKLQYLRSVKSFVNFDVTKIRQMVHVLRTEHFTAGSTVVSRGEPNDTFYLISDGSAEMHASPDDTDEFSSPPSPVMAPKQLAPLTSTGSAKAVLGRTPDGSNLGRSSGLKDLAPLGFCKKIRKPGDSFGETQLFDNSACTSSVYAGPNGLSTWCIRRNELATIFRDDKGPDSTAVQMVLMADPGEDFDDEMALVLARALSDMQLIELRAVIANVAPAHARARLVRGTLDALDLPSVPVGVGSDCGNASAPDTFTESIGYLKRPPDVPDGQALLRRVFITASASSLTLAVLSSFTDLALFMRENEKLFVEKTARVAIMGGVEAASLSDGTDAGRMLRPDNTAATHQKDTEAATFVFQRCQELGVPLVVLTRTAAYAAPLPSFVYDELATIGHPVARRLRDGQIASINALWRRARAPVGDTAERKGLPGRCDRAWFSATFCGGAVLDDVGPDAIWPHVQSFNFYNPLTLLAAVPACLAMFFKPVTKTVNGVRHVVVGAESEVKTGTDCIRNSVALRRFILDALEFSLAASMSKFQ